MNLLLFLERFSEILKQRHFYLVNTRMHSKRDIKMVGCVRGGGGGGSPRNCRWGCVVPFFKW